MDLIILIIIFTGLGYLLGLTRLGGERKPEKAAPAEVKGWSDRLEDSWKSIIDPGYFARRTRAWVSGPGASLFPEDFRSWLGGLSESDLTDFVKALDGVSNSLGYNLGQLVDGGLDRDPRMRQVFVEAITVYSSAYRKARQARQAPEGAQPASAHPSAAEGKPAAEKNPSRRKAGAPNGAVEVASTD